ncbi:MAG: 50S ribosomal protein L30 [Flavobacteriaceae bacterium TMED68]|nr:MAG: 50S ribosomal protein L30 [Flavobacteriaceae bacterium TMED68]|tara:strand:- start:18 stop:197 length:180 start_codon:yes stop_codon:yes gene_type:complete
MAQIKIKQVRSRIKRLQKQKLTLDSLGLKRIGSEVVHEATPSILGMVNKVRHLVSIKEL